jgi:hypothetical protein
MDNINFKLHQCAYFSHKEEKLQLDASTDFSSALHVF